MRALEPDIQGTVEVDGVGIGYEVFGSGPRTIVLAPAWAIVNSRFWKAQVPYLARRFRVVTWDAPGSGRSDRPQDPAHHSRDVFNAFAVLDATDTERALMVGLSLGAATSLFTAAAAPGPRGGRGRDRLDDPAARRRAIRGMATPFDEDLGTDAGWERWTRASWRRDYPGFVEHFVREMLPEPHSEKQIEDAIGWGLDCGRTVLEARWTRRRLRDARAGRGAPRRRATARCWCIHGDGDRISPLRMRAAASPS